MICVHYILVVMNAARYSLFCCSLGCIGKVVVVRLLLELEYICWFWTLLSSFV
jgi:hypothetical protein